MNALPPAEEAPAAHFLASASLTRRMSWGVMLQEAANVAAVADAPWTLAPAAGIFLLVLGVNLAAPPSVPRP